MTAWTAAQLVQAAMTAVSMKYAAPNIYAYGARESDLLGVTPAGIVYEFEAKRTLSDLRRDLEPRTLTPKWCRQQVLLALVERRPPPLGWTWDGRRPRRAALDVRAITDLNEWLELIGPQRRLHETHHAPKAPDKFAFVYPQECADAFDALIPKYAGILHALPSGHAEWARRAPQLHRHRTPETAEYARQNILVSTYHRYWRLRQEQVRP